MPLRRDQLDVGTTLWAAALDWSLIHSGPNTLLGMSFRMAQDQWVVGYTRFRGVGCTNSGYSHLSGDPGREVVTDREL